MDEIPIQITLTIHPSTYRALQALALEEDGNIAAALRKSIALSRWVQMTMCQGKKLLIEDNGKYREIIKF